MNFKIGKKIVGKKNSCIIVAELSGNHNLSWDRMKKLIISAKKSGADIIKIQTYTADTITLNSNKRDFKINKKTPWKKSKNMWELYKSAYTPWQWHKNIFQLCKQIDIPVFSTPFDETAVDFLEKLKCPAYKIASAEIGHIPLLKKVAKTNKPIIISNGLANFKDLKFAINFLKKNGCKKYAILQCVSAYPSPLKEQNLATINKLKEIFKCPVGISDHTIEMIAPLTSVSIGASIIEKHFNLNDKTKTVDSFFSIKEKNFKKMVQKIRKIEEVIGNIDLGVSKSSKRNLNSKRSIYISEYIKKGEKITKNNIRVVRPSFSLDPKYYFKILGKKAKKNFNVGDRIKLKDINK